MTTDEFLAWLEPAMITGIARVEIERRLRAADAFNSQEVITPAALEACGFVFLQTFHKQPPTAIGLYLAVREPCNGERGCKILASVYAASTYPADLTLYDWFYGPLPTEMPKEVTDHAAALANIAAMCEDVDAGNWEAEDAIPEIRKVAMSRTADEDFTINK